VKDKAELNHPYVSTCLCGPVVRVANLGVWAGPQINSRIGKIFANFLAVISRCRLVNSLLTVLMIMMKLSDSCESRLMALSVRLFMTDAVL